MVAGDHRPAVGIVGRRTLHDELVRGQDRLPDPRRRLFRQRRIGSGESPGEGALVPAAALKAGGGLLSSASALGPKFANFNWSGGAPAGPSPVYPSDDTQ